MDQLEAALEASGIGELVKLWVGRIPWPSSGKDTVRVGFISGQEIKILQAMVGRARDQYKSRQLDWGWGEDWVGGVIKAGEGDCQLNKCCSLGVSALAHLLPTPAGTPKWNQHSQFSQETPWVQTQGNTAAGLCTARTARMQKERTTRERPARALESGSPRTSTQKVLPTGLQYLLLDPAVKWGSSTSGSLRSFLWHSGMLRLVPRGTGEQSPPLSNRGKRWPF